MKIAVSLTDFLFANNFELVSVYVFENITHKIIIKFIQSDSQYTDIQSDTFRYIYIREETNLSKIEIIKSRILTFLIKNKTIFARKTFLKRIDKQTAALFFIENHLNGFANAYYKFGLYYKGELVSVMSLNKARNMKYETTPFLSYEIVRYATKSGITIVGGLSKLFQYFVKEFDAVHVMTYTDFDWGVPTGFLKIGFEIEKIAMQSPFWVHKITFERANANNVANFKADEHFLLKTYKNYRLVWRK